MKRVGKFTVIICLCIVFLSGCGETKVPDVVDKPTVSVGKNGEVTVWQIGEFEKAYYNAAELAAMAEQEAAAYNAEKGKEAAVTIEKVEPLEGGRVTVVYRFDGWETCSDYMGETFFFGTVKDAETNGFDTGTGDVSMISVKDGSVRTTWDAAEKVLITDMKADIYCPGRVEYISEGASVNADGSIRPSQEEGPVYILLK
ncbi:MAG: hypothetical protein HFH87_15550 [Lachnospiraceae bacterium]|nr:hypothetical protein [Lachnospiraceae bacterium]